MATYKTGADGNPDETADIELTKCDSCNRELKSSSEWIRSDERLICDLCYRNLLNPNKKMSFEN